MKKTLLTFIGLVTSLVVNAQWVSQATGFSNISRGIDDIEIIDANTVWALAYDGSGGGAIVQEFSFTADGGTTWVPGNINIGNTALTIGNLCAISASTAWVSAFDSNAGLGGVWKTTDNGATWTAQNTTAFTTAGSSWCDGVHFFDANNGIAFGDPVGTDFEVYTTTDGGTTWAAVPAANLPNTLNNEWGYAGSFATSGDALWIMTSRGKLYRTLDKGVTWTKLNTPIADFGGANTATSSGKVYFSDANNGVLIGNTISGTTITSRTLYKTTNGGTTWSTGVTYTQPYTNLCYVPGTTMLVATGSSGTGASTVNYSGFSTDNATTWTQIDSGVQRTSISFFDATTGWAGGFNQDEFTAGIFKFTGNLSTNSLQQNQFRVFPNPAKDFITISTESSDDFSLELTDITGKTLINKAYSGVENTLNISNLNSGVYFISLKMNNKQETIKFVKN